MAGRPRLPTGPRRVLVLVAVLLVVEYFAIPALIGQGRNLDLLGRIHVWWLVAGASLQALSLYSYAMLTRGLVLRHRPGRLTSVGVTLATTAATRLTPAGGAGGAVVGFGLLTSRGVSRTEAGFALGTSAIGSAVVLNLMLLPALAVSLLRDGVRPILVVVALVGLLAILAAGGLFLVLTRGERRAVRAVRAIGARIPRVGADRLEGVTRQLGESLATLVTERRLVGRATTWAALNWLLDAASLWAFVAAFGRFVDPVELFVAYGIAYVLAVVPITPGGLGVIEVAAASLLITFGLPRGIATFGVLGWRLVNFWLPIPLGMLAYLAMVLPHDLSRRSRSGAGRPGPAPPKDAVDDSSAA